MAKILAVDDDAQILNIVKRALEKDNHLVEVQDRVDKVERDKLTAYDLILLDVMMPDMDGFAFCKEIRDSVDCPILFITARTMDMDLMEGFAIGGDDYIRKPFSLTELRARVNAHLRREKREYHSRIVMNDYRFDLSEKVLYYKQDKIELTKSEYDICEFMVKNKGTVFTLEQILEKVFGFQCESDSSIIREHIKNIRAKLKKYEEKPIETVWGIGYKWV